MGVCGGARRPKNAQSGMILGVALVGGQGVQQEEGRHRPRGIEAAHLPKFWNELNYDEIDEETAEGRSEPTDRNLSSTFSEILKFWNGIES